jgi:hypothetical protein
MTPTITITITTESAPATPIKKAPFTPKKLVPAKDEEKIAALPPAFRALYQSPPKSATTARRRYTIGHAERTRRANQSAGRRNSISGSLSHFIGDNNESFQAPKMEKAENGKTRIVIELGEVPSAFQHLIKKKELKI